MPTQQLVRQNLALPLADRLALRDALDDNLENDPAVAGVAGPLDSATTVEEARQILERELLRALDGGPAVPMDDTYWNDLRSRIALQRQARQ